MIIKSRLLDYGYAGADSGPIVHLFTGNAYITKDDRLVMGRGAARMVRDLYPGIDKDFAKVIGNDAEGYGVRILQNKIGVFQVKRHFREYAQRDLIAFSAAMLSWIAKAHPDTLYRMNFPGVGNGGLQWEEVIDIVMPLPDNVELYYVRDVA